MKTSQQHSATNHQTKNNGRSHTKRAAPNSLLSVASNEIDSAVATTRKAFSSLGVFPVALGAFAVGALAGITLTAYFPSIRESSVGKYLGEVKNKLAGNLASTKNSIHTIGKTETSLVDQSGWGIGEQKGNHERTSFNLNEHLPG